MTITFEQFDTTQANLIADICTHVAAHADWEEVTETWTTTNLTVAGGASTTLYTVGSTAGMFPGQRLKFMVNGTTPYWRVVTAVNSATTFTIATLGVTATTATTVATEGRVLKATTSRGAAMIMDILAGDPAAETYRLNLRFWSALPTAYADNVPSNGIDRYVYWRPSGGTSAQILHVTLSLSKEHIFISIEGPRSYETGAVSATYGSFKNYLFMSDLVPYHVEDAVPVVVAHAGPAVSTAAVAAGSFFAFLSRDSGDSESWTACRLGTIGFPAVLSTDTVGLEPNCSIDGNRYIFPYVVFAEDEGMRGRLSHFFNAGSNISSYYGDVSSSSGETVTFGGVAYKLSSVNSTEGATDSWGAFGSCDNGQTTRPSGSVVVAIPFADIP